MNRRTFLKLCAISTVSVSFNCATTTIEGPEDKGGNKVVFSCLGLTFTAAESSFWAPILKVLGDFDNAVAIMAGGAFAGVGGYVALTVCELLDSYIKQQIENNPYIPYFNLRDASPLTISSLSEAEGLVSVADRKNAREVHALKRVAKKFGGKKDEISLWYKEGDYYFEKKLSKDQWKSVTIGVYTEEELRKWKNNMLSKATNNKLKNDHIVPAIQ